MRLVSSDPPLARLPTAGPFTYHSDFNLNDSIGIVRLWMIGTQPYGSAEATPPDVFNGIDVLGDRFV